MEPACRVAPLNPCPLFRQQPTNRRNLIFFGPTLLKAINKLHRQKASCSANLDSSEDQPSLRDWTLAGGIWRRGSKSDCWASPRFPVDLVGVGELHAAFLDEGRTRGRWWGPVAGNPGRPSFSAHVRSGEGHPSHFLCGGLGIGVVRFPLVAVMTQSPTGLALGGTNQSQGRQFSATGRKLRRCSGVGPCARSACLCSGVL
jgi:hypothetical protein